MTSVPSPIESDSARRRAANSSARIGASGGSSGIRQLNAEPELCCATAGLLTGSRPAIVSDDATTSRVNADIQTLGENGDRYLEAGRRSNPAQVEPTRPPKNSADNRFPLVWEALSKSSNRGFFGR